LIGCTNGSTTPSLFLSLSLSLSLSLAFCIDSKKYYNLCLAGREKYNSLFRRVYKEDDNGVPRMGESRPPPREEKGLKMLRGGRVPARQGSAGKLGTEETIF